MFFEPTASSADCKLAFAPKSGFIGRFLRWFGMRSSLSWLLPFGLLAVAIVVVPLQILDEQGLPRYRLLRAELTEVRRQNERLEQRARALSGQVDRLRTDPAAVENVARDELGMVRADELVFQFPAED